MKKLIIENIHNKWNYSGIYRIFYINNRNQKPIPIGRLLGKDSSGLLYIGQSGQNSGYRLKCFFNSTTGQNNHAAGVKIYKNKNLGSFLKKHALFFSVERKKNAKKTEKVELEKYRNIFGEYPPLNG